MRAAGKARLHSLTLTPGHVAHTHHAAPTFFWYVDGVPPVTGVG